MVRYSSLVGLLPPRLHAGLSRRLHSLTVAAPIGARTIRAATVRESVASVPYDPIGPSPIDNSLTMSCRRVSAVFVADCIAIQ